MTDLDNRQHDQKPEEERQLERLLTMPVAEPPAGLADQLKADIPADLGAANDRRPWTPRRPWLTLAAALVTAIGALLLTFEVRRDMPTPGFDQPASESARAAPEQQKAAGAEASEPVGARQEASVAPPRTAAEHLRAKRSPDSTPSAQEESAQPVAAQPAPVQPVANEPAAVQHVQADSEGEVHEVQRLAPRQPAAASTARSPAPRARQHAVGRTDKVSSADADTAGTADWAADADADTDAVSAGAGAEQESTLEEERKRSAEQLAFSGPVDGEQAVAARPAGDGSSVDSRLARLRRFLQHGRWPSPELVEVSELTEVFHRPDLQPVAAAFAGVLERPVLERQLDLASLADRLQPSTEGDPDPRAADPRAAELRDLIELASRIQNAPSFTDD